MITLNIDLHKLIKTEWLTVVINKQNFQKFWLIAQINILICWNFIYKDLFLLQNPNLIGAVVVTS